MHAWVTSVAREEQVDQALVLAWSLRRWRTCMKLVVVVASNVSNSASQRLSSVFELVVRVPQGQEDEEVLLGYPASAILALSLSSSLGSLKKCIYLAPSMLALNNCDHLFQDDDHHDSLTTAGAHGAGQSEEEPPMTLDCFLFEPSLELQQAIRNKLSELPESSRELGQAQMVQVVANLSGVKNVFVEGEVDGEADGRQSQSIVEVILGENGSPTCLSGAKGASIANFKGVHPAQLWRRKGAHPPPTPPNNIIQEAKSSSPRVEIVAVAFAWKILLDKVDKAGEKGVAEEPNRWPTFDELKLLVREDSVLPAHIRVDPASSAPPPARVESVLLTGVTGTLGPFLLYELTSRPDISAVHCLIRKSATLSPTERLAASLKKAGLTGRIDLSKVSCIPGDLSEPLFGLPSADYDSLAAEVHAVVHSGVRVNYNATYWAAPPSDKSALRTVNVGGTLRVLEFCVAKRPKQLCFMSTMLVYAKLGADGCLSEGWQDVDSFDATTINTGYPISKHICEQLVRQAGERGLPAVTVRPPLVGGHSLTGKVEPNHFLLRFLAQLKLGVMPDLSFPLPYIPVDRCAALSLQLFFSSDKKGSSSSDVYNLIPKVPQAEQEFVEVAKREFGIDIRLVSYEEFVDKVVAAAQEDRDGASFPLTPFKLLYKHFASNPDCYLDKIMRGFDANRENFYANEKTVRVIPDLEVQLEPSTVCWGRDLRYLRDIGLFEKFGITSNSSSS